MKSTLYTLLAGLLILAVSDLQAQNDPTTEYSPGFVPPGVQWNSSGNPSSALPTEPESMAKTTASLNIPEALVTPVIDGILSPNEWSDAAQVNGLTVVSAGCVAWFKIDACKLYVAAIMKTPSSYSGGNATMLNIWFDLDRDGQWDTSGDLDGNLALPAPGYLYPPDVAAFGYANLSGWTTSSTGRLRYHRPWQSLGVVVPSNQIVVKRTTFSSSEMHLEAEIDYKTSPLRLTGGVLANMRIQWYAGYYTGGGAVQIQSQWPSVSSSAYFSGPTPSQLTDVLPTLVVAPPDAFDVVDINVPDNPQFSSKAFFIGGNMDIEVEYTSTAPPTSSNYEINLYGPHPSTALYTTISSSIQATQSNGTAIIHVPVNMPAGFYRVEIIVDDPWTCGIKKIEDKSNVLILLPGQVPCTVWPGDVNTDGIVNYGDRGALNKYIYDANLNPQWLNGPGRLAPDYPDPLAEFEWTGQAAAPWATPEGCHMDADGNGLINNFDYIAVKMNWLRSTGAVNPKNGPNTLPSSFAMEQNYPNPFNPSTTLRIALPERAQVHVEIHDMLGRKVAELADGAMDAGTHNLLFEANGLTSGTYFATAVMSGLESGLVYRQSVSMTLTK